MYCSRGRSRRRPLTVVLADDRPGLFEDSLAAFVFDLRLVALAADDGRESGLAIIEREHGA